jgi:hypothetical protein
MESWLVHRGWRVETVYSGSAPDKDFLLSVHVGPLQDDELIIPSRPAKHAVGLWAGIGAGRPSGEPKDAVEKWFRGRLALQHYIIGVENETKNSRVWRQEEWAMDGDGDG